jgi:hypothetical protein
MQSVTPAGVSGIPLPHSPKIPASEMASEHTEAPMQSGIHFSDEATAANKQLLATIDSESISKSSSIKGSLYFYSVILGDDNLDKEELINDPGALDAAVSVLQVQIRHESKHHRWDAQLPHALKILEFAAMCLRKYSEITPGNVGANVELRWRDEKDLETIVHLVKDRDDVGWQVTRYA